MPNLERRDFIKTTAAFSLGGLIQPNTIFSSNDKPIRMGLIGCGSRGTTVLSTMSTHNNVHVTALADLFSDQLNKAKPIFNALNTSKGFAEIKPASLYQGSKSYLQLLRNKEVDAVMISSPSYTHPDFFEAAVAAGKHVYCEKPAGIDVAGCKKVLRVGETIKGRLNAVFGFNVPHASAYAEMIKRVRAGAIGDIINGQLYYLAGKIALHPYKHLSSDEATVRNHYHFQNLCGGILTEQSIHLIDVFNKIIGSLPLDAIGTGNNDHAEELGDTWTNYQVVYRYPKNINVSLHATQLGDLWGDVCVRVIGTKGIAEAHYSGGVYISGENEWDSGIVRSNVELSLEDQQAGKFTSSLHDSDKNRTISFVQSILKKEYKNESKSCVESTLSTILGRRAAELGKRVTWKECLESGEDYKTNIDLTQFDGANKK